LSATQFCDRRHRMISRSKFSHTGTAHSRRSLNEAATHVAATRPCPRCGRGRSGSIRGRIGAQKSPKLASNRLQTTPTGPRTTSNCSRVSCSHTHRSPTGTIGRGPCEDRREWRKTRNTTETGRAPYIELIKSPIGP
jgi:hypothetical protein